MASSRPPSGLHVVHATEAVPSAFTASLFLAGAALAKGPADDPQPPWRQQLVRLLSQRGYTGVVLIPELRSPKQEKPPAESQTQEEDLTADRLLAWEEEVTRHCDFILMWLPKEALTDFAAVSSFGLWQRSGKVILGTPIVDGPLIETATRRRIPVVHSLEDLAAFAQQLCRPGAFRRGGECSVPLSLWRSPSFQSWYRALTQAGHRLEGLELEWTHRARGIGRPPFLWAMRPRVQVKGERRQLNGEVVVGRADVSATVLYHRTPSSPLLETLVVLVREFRAAVRNRTGFAWMLPGGSAASAGERADDARATAAQEVREETGLTLSSAELEPVRLGDRQLLASLSSHHAHLFRAKLSDAQLLFLQKAAAAGKPLGATPSERCYVTVRRLDELLAEPTLDWSQLGMLLYAIKDLQDLPDQRP